MVKKTKTNEEIIKIKKALETKKLIIGSEKTLKELKKGKVQEIFLTINCPIKIKKDILRYCQIQKKNAATLNITNEDLGVVCKKPFSISIIGIIS